MGIDSPTLIGGSLLLASAVLMALRLPWFIKRKETLCRARTVTEDPATYFRSVDLPPSMMGDGETEEEAAYTHELFVRPDDDGDTPPPAAPPRLRIVLVDDIPDTLVRALRDPRSVPIRTPGPPRLSEPTDTPSVAPPVKRRFPRPVAPRTGIIFSKRLNRTVACTTHFQFENGSFLVETEYGSVRKKPSEIIFA
jgi:hypothetical protein